MAQQVTGHVYLASGEYDTYDHWRTFLLTHGVDFDGWYGNQCYDPCALLYFQYGLTFHLGPIGYAYEAWTVGKSLNSLPPFRAIDRLSDIKRGDLLVFRGSGFSYYGHVTFADTDFSEAFYDYYGNLRLYCVGQNQGQGVSWGTPSNRVALKMNEFIGAFRNTNWQQPPTPPPSTEQIKKGFPWAVFTRGIRKTRNSML